jgi:hypothetical protein
MDTKKIALIAGLILLLFFIVKRVRVNSSVPSSTKTFTKTTTTVVHNGPVTGPKPHYNSYKAQYYN